VNKGYVDLARFNKAFDSTQTTSMSGRILASIDAARALMARHGRELLGPVIEATARGRKALREAGIGVIDGEYIDPLKMVILLPETGADGNIIEQELLNANIDLEMANRDVIIPMITLADTPERIDDLIQRVIKLVDANRGEPREIVTAAAFSVIPEVVVSPRDAFFSSYEVVAAKDSVGRVCAELICPYPPGVPVLSPGERITQQAFDALMGAKESGVRIAFVADPTLATIKVLPN
jgi:lysine decarboxylase